MSSLTPGSIALRLIVCIGVTWAGVMLMGLVGLAMTAPIWGVMFAKPILELYPALRNSANRTAMQPWEGKYYRYEETHLRMYFDGDNAWFVADDILAAVGKKRERWMDARFEPGEYQVIPGRSEMGFTPDAVLKFLDMSELPEARKFRLWFERAVVFTLNRKKELRDTHGSR